MKFINISRTGGSKRAPTFLLQNRAGWKVLSNEENHPPSLKENKIVLDRFEFK
jgi:hypothetical protein